METQLAQNIAFLRWVAERVCTATGARREQFVKEYGRALASHFQGVEAVVIPALVRNGLDPEVARTVPAHRALRLRIEAALAEAEDGRQPREVLALVQEALDREYVVLCGYMRQLLDTGESIEASTELQQHLEELGWHAPALEPQDVRQLAVAVRDYRSPAV